MITEERCEKALRYLASTDEEAAELKADVDRSEFKAKVMKAAVFLHQEGTVAEREAKAMTAESVTAAYTRHFKAIRDYQAVANKRALQVLVVECWRTLQANRRVGNV
jgi:hypothetical protein